MIDGVRYSVPAFTRQTMAVITICLCTLVVFAVPLSALAESADSDVSIVRSESTKISNIDDWLIGVFSSTDSINNIQYNWDAECVYTSTGSYKVELSSQNGGSRLKLENGSGDKMKYWIYSYVRRGNNYQMQGHTTSLINLNNLSGSQSLTCADENVVGTNLWFAALVRPADFNPAPPGIYRDVVTLIVSPE